MREFEIKPELHKILIKLFKKDKISYDAVMTKIQEVLILLMLSIIKI
jgi:hypothetical protein